MVLIAACVQTIVRGRLLRTFPYFAVRTIERIKTRVEIRSLLNVRRCKFFKLKFFISYGLCIHDSWILTLLQIKRSKFWVLSMTSAMNVIVRLATKNSIQASVIDCCSQFGSGLVLGRCESLPNGLKNWRLILATLFVLHGTLNFGYLLRRMTTNLIGCIRSQIQRREWR